jgi:hypothetical protein
MHGRITNTMQKLLILNMYQTNNSKYGLCYRITLETLFKISCFEQMMWYFFSSNILLMLSFQLLVIYKQLNKYMWMLLIKANRSKRIVTWIWFIFLQEMNIISPFKRSSIELQVLEYFSLSHVQIKKTRASYIK